MDRISTIGPIFLGFVVLLWVICFTLRMRAGHRSKVAVRQLRDYTEQMLRRNARIADINEIFREVLRGQRQPDPRRMAEYLREYASCASKYQQEQEQWHVLLEKARSALESLRISQNMLGGRNDLAAIPYYTRCSTFNELQELYCLQRTASFDAQLVQRVKQLALNA